MTSRRREIAARRRQKMQNDSSAPQVGALEFLQVGVLRRPHGVKGEMLMSVFTDFPERIQPGTVFYLGNEYTAHELGNRRHHNRGLIVTFVGFEGRDAVESWRNVPVFVRVDDRPPLPEGEYYHHQLLGLSVMTDEGQALGKLADFIETGANDVYIVRDENGNEALLPAIDDVILEIDLEKKQMTVHLLDGLLPE